LFFLIFLFNEKWVNEMKKRGKENLIGTTLFTLLLILSVGIGTVSADGPTWAAKPGWDVPDDVGKGAAPAFVDLDADGDYDLFIGEQYGVSFAYENTGSASSPIWTAKPGWNLPDVGMGSKPAFADLDNDGDYDMLIGEGPHGDTYAYENTGSASSPNWTRKSSWDPPSLEWSGAKPALADLDADGDYDLLLYEAYTGDSSAYENTGSASTPNWTVKPGWNPPAMGQGATPALADLDNDGDYDLLVGEGPHGDTYAYENTGSASTPNWTANPGWNVSCMGQSAKPALADLDNDGDYDLLIGTMDGVVFGFENTASLPSPAIYVNETGWWHDGQQFNASSTPIQSAVNNATAGDTIIIKDGTYMENVAVETSSLTIRSENGSDHTTVHAARTWVHVFKVTASHVNMSELTVTGTSYSLIAGICLKDASNCNISNNVATDNFFGIYLADNSSNSIVSNNLAYSNLRPGIVLHGAFNNKIFNNTAYGNGGSGCALSWESHNNTLINNTIYSCYVGIGSGQGAYNNMICNNRIRDISASGVRIIYGTHNSSIYNNNISSCGVGIEITKSFDNMVYNNNISDSGNGTAFTESSGNRVYLNNFINNTNEVYSEDSTDNLCNSTDEVRYTYNNTTYTDYLGNYWDGYNGDDDDGDGIGDTSFDMGYATDDHPLMEPWENYRIASPSPAFTTADAVIALEIAVGGHPFDSGMDVNGDGVVTSLDALMILQAAAGRI
jgi:parallel beta-helix repeat protein